MKIGFNFENIKKGGGGFIFFSRLKKILERRCLFCTEECAAWIAMPLQQIPNKIRKRIYEKRCRLIVRANGVRHIDFFSFFFRQKNQLLSPFVNVPINHYLNRSMRKNLKMAHHIIFQSRFSQRLTELYVFKPHNDVSIIYNGVEINQSKLSNVPKVKEFTNSFPNLLISHRLAPIKRIHQAPRVIALLKDKYPNLMIHVLGDNAHVNVVKHTKTEAAKYGVEKHFTFWGKIRFDKLAAYYQSADVMLFLSHTDCCPNVIIESLAYGLPVVYTNSGGTPELLGNTGIAVQEDLDPVGFNSFLNFDTLPQIDPEMYARAIIQAIKNKDTLREKTLERAKLFDLNYIADQYIRACFGKIVRMDKDLSIINDTFNGAS